MNEKRDDHSLPKLFRNMLVLLSAVLLGGSYETVKLAACYFALGGVLHRNVVRVGSMETDTRLNFAIVIKPGLGKTSIKNFLRDVFDEIAVLRLPSTLYPEELIGKSVLRRIRGNDKPFKKYGYFADPFIVVDEALPWILRKDMHADRLWAFVNTALDTYQKNTIEKELVGDLPGEKLRYAAECSIILFIQPARFPYRFLSRGILRRFLPIIVDVPRNEKVRAVRQRPRTMPINGHALAAVRTHLKLLNNLKLEWSFENEAIDAIPKHTLSLVRRMERHTSKTVRDYAEIMHYTCENRIAAMAAVLAACEATQDKRLEDFDVESQGSTFEEEPSYIARVRITAQHIHLAARHLRVFMESSVEFIESWVGSDYESVPIQASREIRALTLLKDRGCVSLESSGLSISEYLRELAKHFSCSIETARSIYKGLKRRGLIHSKQTGQRTSKVWITPNGIDFLGKPA
jgi:hypothetical protein